MQEITIPEGHKATILGSTIRIEPIDERQEFEKGDILYHNTDGILEWVFIYTHKDGNSYIGLNCVCLQSGYYYYDYSNYITKEIRIATPEEQQLLFDALAKEGKRWNPDTLEIENIEKRILVPESIGIYKTHEPPFEGINTGDKLAIAFNDNKQVLGFMNGAYIVDILNDKFYSKIQCYLQPCKREDLKAGDTAFISKGHDFFDDRKYYKITNESEYYFMRIFDDSVRRVDINNHGDVKFFKLVPIN